MVSCWLTLAAHEKGHSVVVKPLLEGPQNEGAVDVTTEHSTRGNELEIGDEREGQMAFGDRSVHAMVNAFGTAEEARAAGAVRIVEKVSLEEEARLAEEARAAEGTRAAEAARIAKETRLVEEAQAAEEARAVEAVRIG